VADNLIASIVGGDPGPGERLSGIAELAAHHGVAEGTVKRALGVLRDQGIIVTRHGAGSFVRTDLDVARLEAVSDHQCSDMATVMQLLVEIRDRLDSLEKRRPTGA
jgi:GntR family transcriptional regulator